MKVNPNNAVVIRTQDMTWLKHMRRYHGYLPRGTLVRHPGFFDAITWVEVTWEHEAREDGGNYGRKRHGGYPIHAIEEDSWELIKLVTGVDIEWDWTRRGFDAGAIFLLLGHVVFPWSGLCEDGTVECLSEDLCIQIWQPMNSESGGCGMPFAGNFCIENREVLIEGTQDFKTTKYHKGEIMPGISFELADKTLLRYQSPLVKGAIRRLEEK